MQKEILMPRRYRNRKNLNGLGDLIDDFTSVSFELGTAYNWLLNAKNKVTEVRSSKLLSSWQELILRGEELRSRGAKIQTEPSVYGFIQNIFGASSNIPIVGAIDRVLSSDLAVYTGDAQKFLSDVEQLKLSIDQYKRLIDSGISRSDAGKIIEQEQVGFFEGFVDAVKFPVFGIGIAAIVITAIIFAPEIKLGLKAIGRS